MPLGFGQLALEDIDEGIFQLAVGLLRVGQVIGMCQAQVLAENGIDDRRQRCQPLRFFSLERALVQATHQRIHQGGPWPYRHDETDLLDQAAVVRGDAGVDVVGDGKARGEEAVRGQFAHPPQATRVVVGTGDVERVEQIAAAQVGFQRTFGDSLVVAVMNQQRGLVEAKQVGAAHVEIDHALERGVEGRAQCIAADAANDRTQAVGVVAVHCGGPCGVGEGANAARLCKPERH
ncbi:hypothetical protein D3C81_839500 [compost metagenome]